MSSSMTRSTSRRAGGFILATVLVFLLVLTVTVFFAAAVTRSDIQVVNNLQNEKEALAIAEAGIHEVIYRLSIVGTGTAGAPGANPVTVDGVTFNPSLSPQVPGRDATPDGVNDGASPYGIDGITPNLTSTAQIIFTASAPAAGTNNTAPTLQPASLRIPYSTDIADTGTVNLDATANLTIGWDVCSAAAPSLGCSAASTIRRLPLSDPRPVVKIASTGQSGAARRKVVVWAVDVGPPGPPSSGPPSLQTLSDLCGNGINMNGGTDLTAAGAVQVNAGAADTTSPPCTTVSTGGAQSDITASYVGVSGSATGNISPAAQTGMLPATDPLAGLLPPCFGSITTGCQTLPSAATVQNVSTNAALVGCTGTSSAPVHCSVGSVTLNPGIYYGGLSISGTTTLSPGVYIMAGSSGGASPVSFQSSTGNTGTTSTGVGGVTIYNTRNDNPAAQTGVGGFGSFVLGTGNAAAGLVASTSGPYAGITLFQDRANSLAVDLRGGNSGSYTLDGVFYAPAASVLLAGHTNQTIGGSIIAAGPIDLSGGSNIAIGGPSTPCAACSPLGGGIYTPIAWQDF